MNPANHDLRAFVKEIESIGQLHRIEGTPWDKRHGRSRRDDPRAQQTRARNEAAQLQAALCDGHNLSTSSAAGHRRTNDKIQRLKPLTVARQPSSFSPGTIGK